MDKLHPSNIKNKTEGSVLAKFWRNILEDTGLVNAIDYLIDKYLNKKIVGSMAIQKRKTKSSIWKNVYSEDMTWKIFIDLLFNIANVRKIDISIKLLHFNNEVTEHTMSVPNPNTVESADEKEEKKT